MEEDIDDNFSFGEEEEDNSKQSTAYDNLVEFYNQNFEFLPPQFNEILDSQKMAKLSNLMLDLLHTGMVSPLANDSVQKIELCIRLLIFNASSKITDDKSESEGTEKIQKSDEDKLELMEKNEQLQNDTINMKTKIFSLQHEIKQNKNDIAKLRAEIEECKTEKNRLSKQNLDQKAEFNKNLQNQKNQFNEISEKYEDAIVQLKLLRSVEDRMKTQLDMAHAEADGYAKQSEKLSNALNEKKDKIYELKMDKKKAELKVSELQAQLTNIQNSMHSNPNPNTANNAAPQSLDTSSVDDKRSLSELSVKNETLNRKLSQMSDEIKQRETAIETYRKQLQEKDESLQQQNSKISELTESIDGYKQAVEVGNEKIKKSDEIMRSRAVELNQNRDILNKISEKLSSCYNVQSLNDIPDIVDDLLTQQSEAAIPAQFSSMIDSLTRFIKDSLLIEKADPKLLIGPVPSILNDRELLNEITKEIKDIKDTIEQEYGSKFEQYKMFDSLLSAKEHFTEDSSNCEFAALVVLCAANEKLRRLLISQKRTLERFNKIFPIENLDDIRKLFNDYSKASKQYYSQSFDDNMQLLSAFVDNTTDLLNRLKNEVMHIIPKDCDILELPELIMETFRDLNETREKEVNESSQSYMQQQQSLKNTLNETKSQLESTKMQKSHTEKQNKRLIGEINKLNEKNVILQKLLEEEKSKKNENESDPNKETRIENEEKIKSLEFEIECLKNALETNKKNSQARCDSLVKAEREIHTKEMQRTQQMFTEEKNHLKEEIEKRDLRYKQQKKKAREMIEYLEKNLRDAQQSMSSSALQSPASSVKNADSFSETQADEEFIDSLIKELKRCIQVSAWNKQKIIVAVRKIVDRLIKSSSDEQWRQWGLSIAGIDDRDAKNSFIRKQIESSLEKAKHTESKNNILLFEKKVLSKFDSNQLNSCSEKAEVPINSIVKTILFITIARKIMKSKMKPRKSYI